MTEHHSSAAKTWCPGCSTEVDGVCHHFNCAIGPNGLDAWARSSAVTERADLERLYRITWTLHGGLPFTRFCELLKAIIPDVAQPPVVWGPTQEDVVAHAIMLDDGCGLTINGQRALCDDPRAMEKPDHCYCRRSAKVALAALAAKPPAAPVEKFDISNATPNATTIAAMEELQRSSAGTAEAALDAIERQLEEMRSLKGWRLNLIRENVAKLRAALPQDWLGMSSAPRDRTAILLKFKDRIPDDREHVRRWDGLIFVGRNYGDIQDWGFAAPVSMGGFPDEWLEGWRHITAVPQEVRKPGGAG